MNYNCIYRSIHMKKLQLGPIDAAFQKLQYALKNSARANFFLSCFSDVFSTVFIVDLTPKFLKLYLQVVNSIYFIWAEVRN
jgi:hypothetical protein